MNSKKFIRYLMSESLHTSNKCKSLTEMSSYSNELAPLFRISKGGRRRRVPLIKYDEYPSALQSCLLN